MTAIDPLRHDPAWYTPQRLPDEFVALGQSVGGGLSVGAPGKVGLLELGLARLGGATRVEHHYQRAPLHVYRPIHLDPWRPDMAFIFVQQLGDGFVHGDRCRVDIDCGPDTALHVTTQAATNVYRAERNFATQLVNLRVGPRAVLEYLPEPVVPYRGSRFFQRTSVVVHADSTAILGDVLLAGRVARGERHAYDIYYAETEAHDVNGRLLFADTLRISPGEVGGPSLGMLGDHDVVGTLFVLTRQATNEIVELLRAALAEHAPVLSGVGLLPNDSGVVVRLLGPSNRAVRAALRSAWSSVRLELIGAPAPNLRKG